MNAQVVSFYHRFWGFLDFKLERNSKTNKI